ncbi:hypothetical protein Agabi119p4_1099 [Agaricus bisporus var. burnettii]|uniref:Fatty acid synthase meander beta sheet domain-containing protein n=1 Tax=Agaricus bisporus var. burnettii TaxID=192524 RepID=A0A8H7KKD9_AGABI|nr:hypothetical protein Agabi119p4_1413 [Agaricus bisporus var. burnettii]KAF7784934.1 hypothetical protein Agabi119p4_1099 [Agaricus bisporus var. burnettii]
MLHNIAHYQKGPIVVYTSGSSRACVGDCSLPSADLSLIGSMPSLFLRRLFRAFCEESLAVAVTSTARSYGTHIRGSKAAGIKIGNRLLQLINMIYHYARGVSRVPVLLNLQFHYRPAHGFVPIHEIGNSHDKRTKELYWKLWCGGSKVLSNVDIKETFIAHEVARRPREICPAGWTTLG